MCVEAGFCQMRSHMWPCMRKVHMKFDPILKVCGILTKGLIIYASIPKKLAEFK